MKLRPSNEYRDRWFALALENSGLLNVLFSLECNVPNVRRRSAPTSGTVSSATGTLVIPMCAPLQPTKNGKDSKIELRAPLFNVLSVHAMAYSNSFKRGLENLKRSFAVPLAK
jgi:hypothetical protein